MIFNIVLSLHAVVSYERRDSGETGTKRKEEKRREEKGG